MVDRNSVRCNKASFINLVYFSTRVMQKPYLFVHYYISWTSATGSLLAIYALSEIMNVISENRVVSQLMLVFSLILLNQHHRQLDCFGLRLRS